MRIMVIYKLGAGEVEDVDKLDITLEFLELGNSEECVGRAWLRFLC